MSKSLFIAEKPSVAQEFAKALKANMSRKDGYLESEDYIVTWCVGHLVTMSYPECYDEALKRWTLDTLPFLPKEWKYEVIPAVKKQFDIVSGLLNRDDVTTIYVCTDSGREGEYIYRLVEQLAGVSHKNRKRVWIDSQTEEEILRGIKEAKDLSDYDNLSSSAYLRAKEDYLMGINFSRLLTLKYGYTIKQFLNLDKMVISVGRVMTCVLGMVVRRELAKLNLFDNEIEAEWRAVEGSKYYNTPFLYKENGFKEREKAEELLNLLNLKQPIEAVVNEIENKKETKNPPLLYNLAELQNDCSKLLKISPDETLRITQELYEKKLVTYPRTDARVLSSAVCKEIYKNISGLKNYPMAQDFVQEILEKGNYKNIAKSKYCNDKQITDHYAIIPTGQGLSALNTLPDKSKCVYEAIVRRFLSIFYPPAVYQRYNLTVDIQNEKLFAGFKMLVQEGYLKVTALSFVKKKENDEGDAFKADATFMDALKHLKKGDAVAVNDLFIKEGETSPPKRYNSGSMILAMENAGQLIEDEDLRAQIKGAGIGTSATRAEILKKLVNIKYIALNEKTQIITPTLVGELVFDVVNCSIKQMLNPELTASWEKGLTYVAEGTITTEEYMEKLEHFIRSRTNGVMALNNQYQLRACFDAVARNYKK